MRLPNEIPGIINTKCTKSGVYMETQRETQTESSMGYAEMHHEKEITASEVATVWNSIIQYRQLNLVFDYFDQ